MFQRIEFFSKMKMLESWTYNMIKNLFLVTDQRRYFRNQRVFEEGDEPEALYMIKFGEFTVSKKIKFGKEKNTDNGRDNGHFRESILIEKEFQIALLSVGETFGEEELIKKTVRNFSIKCVSTFADVYMLKKKEFDSRIMPNFLAMGSILAQIDIKERSRQKRINEFINKFQTITPKPLFSPKNHIKTSYKSELDLQLNETPQPKTPNNIQNFFFKSISNKNNNQDHEFSSPLEKFEKMSKHSPEPFLLKDFNVKDTLYPELSNIALQNRLRAVTAVKSPKKNEEMPRKQVKKRTFSEKMKKQGITLNISIPFIDFDIPFINTKNTIMDNKSSKIEPQNLKSPQEYKEKYINKAYHWEKNMKSSSSNSLLNTYLKKISSGNSIDLTQKYLSPNQSRIKTIFNGNWTKYQNVRKKKFFKNISEIQSFNFAKYEFPCAN